MSILVAPPVEGLSRFARLRYRSPRRHVRLALVVLVIAVVAGGVAWYALARRPYRVPFGFTVVAPLALGMIALLGVLVRTAELRIWRSGLRWGWGFAGITRDATSIVKLVCYQNGVAVHGRRGVWFLAHQDWEGLSGLHEQLAQAQFGCEHVPANAPVQLAMHGYGRALNGLLIGVGVAQVGIAVFAVGRAFA